MLLNKIHKIDLFAYILFFFLVFYFFNIFIIHQNFEEVGSAKLLLLNYDGGFVRRALLGEIVTSISLFFNVNFKYVFLLIHIINYLIFFYLNYFFFKKFKKNYIFYFFVFSPLYLTFSLGIISSPYAEFLIQREVYLINFFLFFCYLIEKSKNRLLIYFTGLIGITIMSFIYELTIITYPFFFTIYYFFLKKNNFKIDLYEIFFAFLLCLSIIFLHLSQYGNNNLSLVINNLNQNFDLNYSKNDFMFSWINQGIIEQINLYFSDFKISYIFKYLFYSHPIILLLYVIAKKVQEKIFVYLVCLSSFSFLIIFVIAIDWARFVHILYCFVLYIFCLLIDNKNTFISLSKINFLTRFNIKFLNIFVFFYCTMWTLEHTYWQNHLSYGIFNIIQKNFLYLY